MIIGLSGYAKSGKDTFFHLLNKGLDSEAVAKRLAFADKLKDDLKGALSNLGVDLDNCSSREKDLVRPIMVSYGMAARRIDENHWIRKIENEAKDLYAQGFIVVITDVRYLNEAEWIKDSFDNSIIVDIERSGVEPANLEELNNHPKIKQTSEYHVKWNTFGNDNIHLGMDQVNNFINEKIRQPVNI